MELMIVVMLVSILTMLAVPAMRVARDDRLCFDYARSIAGIMHRARTRAASRGAAHLIVFRPGAATRGSVLLFEGLDGVTGPAPPGPNPSGSCRTVNWSGDVTAFVPGAAPGVNARIVEGLDLNTSGVNVDADIAAQYRSGGGAFNANPVMVICITTYGTTYVGSGTNVGTAVTNMLTQQPFADVVEVKVQRGLGSGAPVGIARTVVMASDATPRVRSQ